MRDKKLKARTGGEKGRHLWPWLVQKLQTRSVKKQKMLSKASKENTVRDACYDRGAPRFFFHYPQFGSLSPLPKTDLEKK